MCLSPTQRALRGTKLRWRAPGASPGSQGSALCHLHPAQPSSLPPGREGCPGHLSHRVRTADGGCASGLPGRRAGDPGARAVAGRLRPGRPAGQPPALRSPPRKCSSPSPPGPPPAHLAWTAAARTGACGHAPGVHPPCRVPVRWPLPGPQAPRSALPRGGERTRRRRRLGWGPHGQRGRRRAWRAKSPRSASEMLQSSAPPAPPWTLAGGGMRFIPDPLYGPRLGEG